MRKVSEIISTNGGATQIARKLNVPVQTVWAWGLRNRVPAERVLEIERTVGISRHELRPDIYPPPNKLARK